MKYNTYMLLVNYITIDLSNAFYCEGPLTAKTLTDNSFYMEYSGGVTAKDFKDESTNNKIYISDFFNPGGNCDLKEW